MFHLPTNLTMKEAIRKSLPPNTTAKTRVHQTNSSKPNKTSTTEDVLELLSQSLKTETKVKRIEQLSNGITTIN